MKEEIQFWLQLMSLKEAGMFQITRFSMQQHQQGGTEYISSTVADVGPQLN